MTGILNPFRAPEPLPILNPSNFVPKNGFPVGKGLIPKIVGNTTFFFGVIIVVYLCHMGFFIPGSSFNFLQKSVFSGEVLSSQN